MFNRNFRQLVVAITLIALFGAPLTSAAAPRRAGMLGERSVTSGLFTWFWGFLEGSWSKEGCRIDPDGCLVTPSTATDNGCLIDPNGRCVDNSQQTTKEGCRIDPNGHCIP